MRVSIVCQEIVRDLLEAPRHNGAWAKNPK